MRTSTRQIAGIRSLLFPVVLVAGCGGGGGLGAPQDSGPAESLISPDLIVDGGPGRDGIPALSSPRFEAASTIQTVAADDLVVVVRDGDAIKAFPEDILDWHEIVNDATGSSSFTLSYCPLTASAVAWLQDTTDSNPTFGVSGLLYNSNLILFDRETDTIWAQMLQLAISGERIREVPTNLQVLEMPFATLQNTFPDAQVLTRETGHNRNYDRYPYGSYRSDNLLLFPVVRSDQRLHSKARAIGIHTDNDAKVYQLDGFGPSTQTINDNFMGQSIVVVGNSADQFSAIYSSELSDGSVLGFTPIQDDLPNVMTDAEGGVWDIFGTAVSGPRAGEQLATVRSYSAMWFAWSSFFSNVQIHFN